MKKKNELSELDLTILKEFPLILEVTASTLEKLGLIFKPHVKRIKDFIGENLPEGWEYKDKANTNVLSAYAGFNDEWQEKVEKNTEIGESLSLDNAFLLRKNLKEERNGKARIRVGDSITFNFGYYAAIEPDDLGRTRYFYFSYRHDKRPTNNELYCFSELEQYAQILSYSKYYIDHIESNEDADGEYIEFYSEDFEVAWIEKVIDFVVEKLLPELFLRMVKDH